MRQVTCPYCEQKLAGPYGLGMHLESVHPDTPEAAESRRKEAQRPTRLKMPYDPPVAALLNVFPFPLGFGYLYLGRPVRFIAALFAGIAAFIGGALMAFTVGMVACLEECPSDYVTLLLWLSPALVIAGVTALDAWSVARK